MFDCYWTSLLLSCIHFTQASLPHINAVYFLLTDTHMTHTHTHTHTHTFLFSFPDSALICMHTSQCPDHSGTNNVTTKCPESHQSLLSACVWYSQHSSEMDTSTQGWALGLHSDETLWVSLYSIYTLDSWSPNWLSQHT